jgi:hypothetical protein
MTELTAAEQNLNAAIDNHAESVQMMKAHTTLATVRALRSRADAESHAGYLAINDQSKANLVLWRLKIVRASWSVSRRLLATFKTGRNAPLMV